MSARDVGKSSTMAAVPMWAAQRVEVAKFLMNTVRRYIADKASSADVDKAVELWRVELLPRGL